MSKWAGSNNSRRYAVSIIDCFSKYAWLLLITQKKTEKVLVHSCIKTANLPFLNEDPFIAAAVGQNAKK